MAFSPSGLHIPNFKFPALGPLKFAVFMHFTGFLAHMLAQGLTTYQISELYFHTFDLNTDLGEELPPSVFRNPVSICYMQRCLHNLFTPRLLSLCFCSVIQKPLLEIKFVQCCRFFSFFLWFCKTIFFIKTCNLCNKLKMYCNEPDKSSVTTLFIISVFHFHLLLILPDSHRLRHCRRKHELWCFLLFCKSLTMRPSPSVRSFILRSFSNCNFMLNFFLLLFNSFVDSLFCV